MERSFSDLLMWAINMLTSIGSGIIIGLVIAAVVVALMLLMLFCKFAHDFFNTREF